jgi:hypothetical protein
MTVSLAERLDVEWERLASAASSRRALAHWSGLEPALSGWSDLEQVRATAHDRTDPERADRILAALVRLAALDGHADPLATRVLLQLLIPGAVRLAGSLTAMLGDRRSAEAAVFGELAIGIRTYPWRRRPARVAANLLLDCRQRLTRRHQRTRPEVPAGIGCELDLQTPDTSGIEAAEAAMALRDLLDWAHRHGVLDPQETRLLLASHVHDMPVSELVAVFGRSRSSLFAARATAERRLREALTDGSQSDGHTMSEIRH